MLPPDYARARQRPCGAARLSALHRGTHRALTLGSTPGRASWNYRVQTGGPSPAPVQRAPRGPVLMPAGRCPKPPECGVTKPARGDRARSIIGRHRLTPLHERASGYVTITGTNVNGSVTTYFPLARKGERIITRHHRLTSIL